MSDPLLVDLYAGDGRGAADVRRLARAGAPWHGVWFKASEGLVYRSPGWLREVWQAANGFDDEAIAARLGNDWWTSVYHYFHGHVDGVAQAEFFAREVELAGGWTRGTFYPVVDVEEGTNRDTGVSARRIADGVYAFSERLEQISGRPTVLYCGWWLRQKFLESGIKTRMGCKYIIPAAYTTRLDPRAYTDIGFDLASLFAWQYCGDGFEVLDKYPGETPLGPEDISALTIAGGGQDSLDHLRSQEWGAQQCGA